MQTIRVEFSDLSPDAADRLINILHTFLANESEEIRLEIKDDSLRLLALPAGRGKTLYLPRGGILYVTSDRHWCIFRLKNDTRRIRINYSEVRRLLPEDEFIECSRGVLLSFRYILHAQQDHFLMTDGAAFPIRRKGRKEILLRWEQYHLTRTA